MTMTTQRHTGLANLHVNTDVVLRVLGLAVAACLAVDARVHWHDAPDYSAVRTSVLSQETLFRIEAVVSVALAIAVVLWPRRQLVWLAATGVLVSALAAVLVYTYVDIGQLGPVPDMYEPTWALPGKATSAWAEGIGAGLALVGLLIAHRKARVARTRA